MTFSSDKALSDLLGIPFDPTADERDISSLETIGISVQGADRAALKISNPKAYDKVKEIACSSTKDKFSLMKVIDEKSSVKDFQSIYSIDIRLRELDKALKESDLSPVFTVFTSWEDTIRSNRTRTLPVTPDAGGSSINLIKRYNGTTLDNIKKSTEFWMLSGADHHVEDIRWSGEKILASCEDTLREKILESCYAIPQIYHGGPLYFYYMMNLVTTTSDQAMRVVIDKVNRLRLTDFDGENVLLAVSFLRGAIQLLSNNNSVPHDILNSVFNMMRAASTPAFVSFVTNLETVFDLPDLVKDKSVEFLLDKLESKYTTLLGSNQWMSSTSQASSFKAVDSSNPQSAPSDDDVPDVICFNCGALGHKVTECSLPRNAETVKRYMAIVQGSSNSNKGRGRRSGGGKDKEKDNNKPPPDALRTPPRPNEPHTKSFASLGERHWCGRCCCWTDHGTPAHPSEPSANTAAPPSVVPSDDSVSIASGNVSGTAATSVDADGFQPVTNRRGARITYSNALMNGANF